MPTIDGTWRRWHRRDLRIELIDNVLQTIGLLDEAYKPVFDLGCFGYGEGGLSLHLDSKFASDLLSNVDYYFRVYLGSHHLRDFMLRKDDHGYTVADMGVLEYAEIQLDPLDRIAKWRPCLPETSAGTLETPDDTLDNGFKWIVDRAMGPNAYDDPVTADSRVQAGFTIAANTSAHPDSQVITQAHKLSLYEFLQKWGQNWDIDWWVELIEAGGAANVMRFCTAYPRRGEDKTDAQGYPAKRVIIDDTGLEVSEARAFREHDFFNVVYSDDLTKQSIDADSIAARGRRELIANESDSDGLDVIRKTRRQRDGDEVVFHETEMCQLFEDIMPGDLVTYRNGRIGLEAVDTTVKNIHIEFDDQGWLVGTITLGDWERDLSDAVDEKTGGGGGGGGAVWSDPLLGNQVGATFVPFSDSDPSTITLTASTGITLTPNAGASSVTIAVTDYVPSTRQIISGNGLAGGGDLSADRTLSVGPGTGISVGADVVNIADTAVTPATYGDATHVGQFTVDQQGRLTLASSVVIAGVAPAVHDIVGGYHSVAGATMDVVGLVGATTLGLLSPKSDTGGANQYLLMSDASGYVTVERIRIEDANSCLYGAAGQFVMYTDRTAIVLTNAGGSLIWGNNYLYKSGGGGALGDTGASRWGSVNTITGNFTGDITIGTGKGIIHADGVTAGYVLRFNGTRAVPGQLAVADISGFSTHTHGLTYSNIATGNTAPALSGKTDTWAATAPISYTLPVRNSGGADLYYDAGGLVNTVGGTKMYVPTSPHTHNLAGGVADAAVASHSHTYDKADTPTGVPS